MDEVERMVVGVRADTAGFAREVEAMRGTLEGALGAGAERAGRSIESALLHAVRSGKFGFEELKGVALAAMAQIAKAALHAGVGAVLGGGGTRGGGGGGGDGAGERRRSPICWPGWACRGARPAGRWWRGAAMSSASAGRNCSCRRRADASRRRCRRRVRATCA
jgi:hypothetical protein